MGERKIFDLISLQIRFQPFKCIGTGFSQQISHFNGFQFEILFGDVMIDKNVQIVAINVFSFKKSLSCYNGP